MRKARGPHFATVFALSVEQIFNLNAIRDIMLCALKSNYWFRAQCMMVCNALLFAHKGYTHPHTHAHTRSLASNKIFTCFIFLVHDCMLMSILCDIMCVCHFIARGLTQSRSQAGALHPLGICRVSQKNMLIRIHLVSHQLMHYYSIY